MFIFKYLSFIFIVFSSLISHAGEVKILAVNITHQYQDDYVINVKLLHQDSGWEHYADAWRVVDQNGAVLATRVLHHPHVQEQPFTRALPNIQLVKTDTPIIYIEAHDKKHGWTQKRLEIDLTQMAHGKLTVKSSEE